MEQLPQATARSDYKSEGVVWANINHNQYVDFFFLKKLIPPN